MPISDNGGPTFGHVIRGHWRCRMRLSTRRCEPGVEAEDPPTLLHVTPISLPCPLNDSDWKCSPGLVALRPPRWGARGPPWRPPWGRRLQCLQGSEERRTSVKLRSNLLQRTKEDQDHLRVRRTLNTLKFWLVARSTLTLISCLLGWISWTALLVPQRVPSWC